MGSASESVAKIDCVRCEERNHDAHVELFRRVGKLETAQEVLRGKLGFIVVLVAGIGSVSGGIVGAFICKFFGA